MDLSERASLKERESHNLRYLQGMGLPLQDISSSQNLLELDMLSGDYYLYLPLKLLVKKEEIVRDNTFQSVLELRDRINESPVMHNFKVESENHIKSLGAQIESLREQLAMKDELIGRLLPAYNHYKIQMELNHGKPMEEVNKGSEKAK